MIVFDLNCENALSKTLDFRTILDKMKSQGIHQADFLDTLKTLGGVVINLSPIDIKGLDSLIFNLLPFGNNNLKRQVSFYIDNNDLLKKQFDVIKVTNGFARTNANIFIGAKDICEHVVKDKVVYLVEFQEDILNYRCLSKPNVNHEIENIIYIYHMGGQFLLLSHIANSFKDINAYAYEIKNILPKCMGQYCNFLLENTKNKELKAKVESIINETMKCHSFNELTNNLFKDNKYLYIHELMRIEPGLIDEKKLILLNATKKIIIKALNKVTYNAICATINQIKNNDKVEVEIQNEYQKKIDEIQSNIMELDIENGLTNILMDYNFLSKTDIHEKLLLATSFDDLLTNFERIQSEVGESITILIRRLRNWRTDLDKYNFLKKIIDKHLSNISIAINEVDSVVVAINSKNVNFSNIINHSKFKQLNLDTIKEINIYVDDRVYLDCDFKFPGKNFILRARQINVQRQVVIDVSGKDAADPESSKAANGTEVRMSNNKSQIASEVNGQAGAPGQDGQAGQSSGNIYLKGEIINGEKLTLIGRGGRGGNGQDGGDGEPGKDGKDGTDAEEKNNRSALQLWRHAYIHEHKEKNGNPGGKGGDSGREGLGGLGGKAGLVIINEIEITGLAQQNSDKIIVTALKGADGTAGKKGEGGSGGKGGHQGSDYGCQYYGYLYGTTIEHSLHGEFTILVHHHWYGKTRTLVRLKTQDQVHQIFARNGQQGIKSELLASKEQIQKRASENQFISIALNNQKKHQHNHTNTLNRTQHENDLEVFQNKINQSKQKRSNYQNEISELNKINDEIRILCTNALRELKHQIVVKQNITTQRLIAKKANIKSTDEDKTKNTAIFNNQLQSADDNNPSAIFNKKMAVYRVKYSTSILTSLEKLFAMVCEEYASYSGSIIRSEITSWYITMIENLLASTKDDWYINEILENILIDVPIILGNSPGVTAREVLIKLINDNQSTDNKLSIVQQLYAARETDYLLTDVTIKKLSVYVEEFKPDSHATEEIYRWITQQSYIYLISNIHSDICGINGDLAQKIRPLLLERIKILYKAFINEQCNLFGSYSCSDLLKDANTFLMLLKNNILENINTATKKHSGNDKINTNIEEIISSVQILKVDEVNSYMLGLYQCMDKYKSLAQKHLAITNRIAKSFQIFSKENHGQMSKDVITVLNKIINTIIKFTKEKNCNNRIDECNNIFKEIYFVSLLLNKIEINDDDLNSLYELIQNAINSSDKKLKKNLMIIEQALYHIYEARITNIVDEINALDKDLSQDDRLHLSKIITLLKTQNEKLTIKKRTAYYQEVIQIIKKQSSFSDSNKSIDVKMVELCLELSQISTADEEPTDLFKKFNQGQDFTYGIVSVLTDIYQLSQAQLADRKQFLMDALHKIHLRILNLNLNVDAMIAINHAINLFNQKIGESVTYEEIAKMSGNILTTINDYYLKNKDAVYRYSIGHQMMFRKNLIPDQKLNEDIFYNNLQLKLSSKCESTLELASLIYLEVAAPKLHKIDKVRDSLNNILRSIKTEPYKIYVYHGLLQKLKQSYEDNLMNLVADEKIEEKLRFAFELVKAIKKVSRVEYQFFKHVYDFYGKIYSIISMDLSAKDINEKIDKKFNIFCNTIISNTNKTLNDEVVARVINQCLAELLVKTNYKLIFIREIKLLLTMANHLNVEISGLNALKARLDDFIKTNPEPSESLNDSVKLLREAYFISYFNRFKKLKLDECEINILRRLFKSDLEIDRVIKISEALNSENTRKGMLLQIFLNHRDSLSSNSMGLNDKYKKVFLSILNEDEFKLFDQMINTSKNDTELNNLINTLSFVDEINWKKYFSQKISGYWYKELLSKLGVDNKYFNSLLLTLGLPDILKAKLLNYGFNVLSFYSCLELNIDICLADIDLALTHLISNQLYDQIDAINMYKKSIINIASLGVQINQLLNQTDFGSENTTKFIKKFCALFNRTNNIENNVLSIANILAIASEINNSEKVFKIADQNLPENWLSSFAYYQLNAQILLLVKKSLNNADINEIPEFLSTHLFLINKNVPLMQLLCKMIRQENALISNGSRLTINDLSEVLALLVKTYIDEHLIDELYQRPITIWKHFLGVHAVLEKFSKKFNDKNLLNQINNLTKRFHLDLIVELVDKLVSLHPTTDLKRITHIINGFYDGRVALTKDNIAKISEINKTLNEPSNPVPTIKKVNKYTLDELMSLVTLDVATSDKNENPITAIKLREHIVNINNYFDQGVLTEINSKPINQLTEDDIKKWLKYFTQSKEKKRSWFKCDKNKYQMIAVIMRGIQLKKGDKYRVRDTQLLALWLYLDARQSELGRLGQVATGEGKTIIMCMFAIIQGLLGEQVNIITSSSVLAKRDAKNNQSLYTLFNLGVTNNCDEMAVANLEERKKRYVAPIVYGDVGSFQRDILVSNFEGKDVLGNRKDEIIVVDEVDSMLLDKNDNTLYLSHEIPDLSYLMPLYIEIWCVVNSPDLTGDALNSNVEMIRERIHNRIKEKNIIIPRCLQEFVNYRLSIWIEMALSAKEMSVDEEYVIRRKNHDSETDVIIMDNDTGVEQIDTQWNNGLHQFLQLLNCRKLKSESLKAIYMSNLTYFQNYKGRIYGITGTLGLESDKKLLTQIYNVDFFKLPRFKRRQFKEETGIIVENQEKQFEQIANHVLTNIINKNRAVLIICKNPKVVKQLYEHLKSLQSLNSANIIEYDSSYKELSIGAEEKPPLKKLDVIIATNIGARGTDLNIDKILKKNGGLDVVSTYLPPDIRIEEQIFGRAARKGNPGTGRYIICDNSGDDLNTLREKRDITATHYIENFRISGLQTIDIERKLFDKFTTTYETIKEKLNEKFKHVYGELFVTIQLHSLKCHWAFWLDSMEPKTKSVTKLGEEAIIAEYNKFHEAMLALTENERLYKFVQLPHELVKLGDYFVSQNKYDEAIACFDKVIIQNSEHAEVACLHKALLLGRTNKKDNANYSEFKKLLKSAKNLMMQRIQEILASNEIAKKIIEVNKELGKGQFKNDFEIQNKNEIHLYRVHIHCIETILGSDFNLLSLQNSVPIEFKSNLNDLFNALVKNSTIIKNFRISKKINGSLTTDSKSLFVRRNGRNNPITLPLSLSYCQDDILKVIEKHQGGDKRNISQDDFNFLPMSQDALWEKLKSSRNLKEPIVRNNDRHNSKDLKKSKSKYVIRIDMDKLNAIDFGLYNGSIDNHRIVQFLKEKNGNIFSKKIFKKYFLNPSLNDNQLNNIKNLLLEAGLLLKTKTGSLELQYSVKKKHFILPSDMKNYQELFKNIFKEEIEKIPANENIIVLKRTVNLSDLPLPENNSNAMQLLWNCLLDQGVIKPYKVNFSLGENKNKDAINQRLDRIKAEMRKIVITLLPGDENKQKSNKLADSAFEGLKNTIGKLNQTPDFTVGTENIYNLLGKNCPPEINKFITLFLDEVITFSERTSWWNWGAFAVAMLGIAQIAAGIVLILCSGTLLANIGAALISEGVGDIIYAAHAGITGTFTWKNYGLHKVFSVISSALTVLSFGTTRIVQIPGFRNVTDLLIFAASRIGVEIAKNIGTKFASMALEKICSQLPHEVQLRLGVKINQHVTSSESINTQTNKLRTTMHSLFSVVEDVSAAKMIIEKCVAEVVNDSHGNPIIKQITATAFSLAEQIPTQILLASGTSSAFYLASLVALIVNGAEFTAKVCQLANIIPSALTLLEQKLKVKIDEFAKNNADAVLNKETNQENYKYIDSTIENVKEKLITIMLNRFSSEIFMPTIVKNLNTAISELAENVSRIGTSSSYQQRLTAEEIQIIRQKRAEYIQKQGRTPADIPSSSDGHLLRAPMSRGEVSLTAVRNGMVGPNLNDMRGSGSSFVDIRSNYSPMHGSADFPQRIILDNSVHASRISHLSGNMRGLILGDSLVLLRESIVEEIKAYNREQTENEINKLHDNVVKSRIDLAKHKKDFLSDIKNSIKNFIALILVDKNISKMIGLLEHDKKDYKKYLLSDQSIINKAEAIVNNCFRSTSKKPYDVLITFLNQEYDKDHSDVCSLLTEVKNLFIKYETQKRSNNTESECTRNYRYRLFYQGLNTQPNSLSNHIDSTWDRHLSDTMGSISDIIVNREHNKKQILDAQIQSSEIINEAIRDINASILSSQKSKNKIISSAIEKFTKTCKFEDLTPENINNFKQQKLIERGVPTLIDQLNSILSLIEINPHDQRFFNEYLSINEEITASQKIVDDEIAQLCQKHKEQINNFQKEFNNLLISLNISDTSVISEAVNFQNRLVSTMENILNITKNPTSINNNFSHAKNKKQNVSSSNVNSKANLSTP